MCNKLRISSRTDQRQQTKPFHKKEVKVVYFKAVRNSCPLWFASIILLTIETSNDDTFFEGPSYLSCFVVVELRSSCYNSVPLLYGSCSKEAKRGKNKHRWNNDTHFCYLVFAIIPQLKYLQSISNINRSILI